MSSERVLEIVKEQIYKIVPNNAGITKIEFEGPEVGIYSKNIDVLVDDSGLVSNIARTIKKRVVLRSDPSIRLDHELVREKIIEIIGERVKVGDIDFDETLGEVLIRVDKPSKIYRRNFDFLKQIIIATKWRPHILRIPPIQSSIIRTVRTVFSTDAAERTNGLQRFGKIVHREPLLKEPIVRITALGGYLEVGRSSTLLQTGDANILIDCGVSVGSTNPSNMLPRFDLPEFNIENLDAVIISHAHLDHCLPYDTPIQMEDGSWKYIGDIKKGEIVLSMDWEKGKIEPKKVTSKTKTQGHNSIYNIYTTYQNIRSSSNHRYFTVSNLEIIELEAKDLKLNMMLPLFQYTNSSESQEIQLDTHTEYNGKIKLSCKIKKDLKESRIKRELSQKDLADIIGVGPITISKMETSGHFTTFRVLNKILKVYNIDYNSFAEHFELPFLPNELHDNLAQLVGYIQSDGIKSSEYSIRIAGIDYSLLKHYQLIIMDIFNYVPIIKEPSDVKGIYYLYINNKMILNYLENNFDTVLSKSRKIRIPKIIENQTPNIIASYLRGLFDTGGSPIPSLKLTSYNNILISKVQNLLCRLGIYAAYNKADRSIYINTIDDKIKFQEFIGFSSKRKSQKLNQSIVQKRKSAYFPGTLVPISPTDFKNILQEIGYLGKANNCPAINDLPVGLLDFYRLEKGYISRKNARLLIEFLKNRYFELNQINVFSEKINILRKNLSLTQVSVSSSTGISLMQLQNRERGYFDELTVLIREFLKNQLHRVLSSIQVIISKLEHIISLPINWTKIKKIEVQKNYEALYDIEVEKNHNFIANSLIIHNCGFVPFLYKYGYSGPVYTTEPTRDLMTMLQIDYLDVALKEGKLLPYSKSDIRTTTLHTLTIGYGEVTDIAPGVKLTLHNAGHILGSSIVHLHIGNGKYNIAFAHDFKFANSRLLDRAHHKFPRLETIIMESTYGNPQDITPSREESEEEITKYIIETIANQGKVLIPVLAVGRAQELQLVIESLIKNERIPNVPVFLEGMITEATAITTSHPEFVSRQLRERIFVADDNPFLADCFHKVESIEERDEIIGGEPCIIMATSGMLVGGPSVYYFKNLASDPKNTVIFVSYQGKGSLGRRIVEGAKEVIVKNEMDKTIAIKVNLNVQQVRGFTGHSDRRELIEYAKRLVPRPKQFLFVHGEASKCETLAKTVGKTVRREARAPAIGTTFRLY